MLLAVFTADAADGGAWGFVVVYAIYPRPAAKFRWPPIATT